MPVSSPCLDSAVSVLDQSQSAPPCPPGGLLPNDTDRYTDSAYDSGEDRHSEAQASPAPYYTPPPETKLGIATKKRKRMADDDTEIAIPPHNPRRKPPKRQIVFVDPDDAMSPWWWPAMVVPKQEFQIFKKSVNGEVKDPKEGECVVVYFEDASYNTIRESELKPFCPSQPPYTTYMNGPNGKAFRSDKAVILATLYWERGTIPPAFSWLQECQPDDRARSAKVQEDGSVKEEDAGQRKKSTNSSTANSRRGSQAALPRKDSLTAKDVTVKRLDKAVKKSSVVPVPVAGGTKPKAPSTNKLSMPIVNLTTSGSACTSTKPKALNKGISPEMPTRVVQQVLSNGDSLDLEDQLKEKHTVVKLSSTSRNASVRRPPGGTSGAVCAKCGFKDAKQRRVSSAQIPVANIGHGEGITSMPLCKECREVFDDVLPSLEPTADDEDPVWTPERRPIRLLKHLLPENRTDRLVRHFKAMQELAHREQLTRAAPSSVVHSVAIIPSVSPAQLLSFAPQYTARNALSSSVSKQGAMSSAASIHAADTPVVLSPYASPPPSATAALPPLQVERGEGRI
ncbi:hypothetical protein SpCBS45565_g05201 [Spizellomyces sp. 'palustris']|nr:hypothetical protein SpCBS45565_g05201 [Spizellomyces sp. 'palustris']